MKKAMLGNLIAGIVTIAVALAVGVAIIKEIEPAIAASNYTSTDNSAETIGAFVSSFKLALPIMVIAGVYLLVRDLIGWENVRREFKKLINRKNIKKIKKFKLPRKWIIVLKALLGGKNE